jgi:uncharacterized protein
MKKFVWQGRTFWLHPHRLLFWEEEKILIGSDLHLGKVGHFRKAGIALPQQVYKQDLHRLFSALQYFQPKQFLIVGDLFHSDANKEMDWFLRWRADFSALDFLLIRGNHDKLSDEWYEQRGIAVCPNYTCGGLHFVHDPNEEPVKHQLLGKMTMENEELSLTNSAQLILPTISGHIHPGVRLNGFARQSVQLPCFYFTPSQCILPAFGLFTGLYTVRPQHQDKVFVVLENDVIELGNK